MLHDWLAEWFASRAASRQCRRGASPRPQRFVPRLEQLEPREMFVVGVNAVPATVMPGGDFDGVVKLTGPDGETGSGALLATGRHILTAAHVVAGTAGLPLPGTDVVFNLIRDGNPIEILLRVPQGDRFITLAPGFDRNSPAVNDLAILALPDQIGNSPNEHLVAPFGAQRYQLFTGNAVGQTYTFVGYGQSGDGRLGNTNEIQNVRIQNPVANGTFTLTFDGQTTRPIPQNATAARPTP